MIAHALTGGRLLLAVPVTLGMARPDTLPALLLFTLVLVAIGTDVADGRVARSRGTASAAGQLFDHGTDFLFVTSGLTGAALAGATTAWLPPLIAVAFAQYVLDSYFLYRQRRLRMSALGRWNGILYFVPLVVLPVARWPPLGVLGTLLATATSLFVYGLVASTAASIVDRALAPVRTRA